MSVQDTGKFRENKKEQYYTNSDIAKSCVKKIIEHIPNASDYLFIEPSAGNGVFMKHLPENYKVIGIDLEPKHTSIIKGDYLEWSPTQTQKRIVFGNPPFGSQSKLAKAFIKHSCNFADYIAFILPKSFVKPSMYRAFDSNFHCIYSEELPKHCFEVNKKAYDVPCIFVIYQKKDQERKVENKIKEVGFSYVKNQKDSDISFRRVGGNAGKAFDSTNDTYSIQAHNFIKLDPQYLPKKKEIIEKICAHVFPSNTVGPRSLSKSEANLVINLILASYA
uniref:Methyltransferase n=1 Tax=viral metagenome TaxID=1070528 RepID=A0A6C0D6C9_9ZZZZ